MTTETNEVTRWEYCWCGEDEDKLNELGADGWEVCGVSTNPETGFASVLMKRRVVAEAAQ